MSNFLFACLLSLKKHWRTVIGVNIVSVFFYMGQFILIRFMPLLRAYTPAADFLIIVLVCFTVCTAGVKITAELSIITSFLHIWKHSVVLAVLVFANAAFFLTSVRFFLDLNTFLGTMAAILSCSMSLFFAALLGWLAVVCCTHENTASFYLKEAYRMTIQYPAQSAGLLIGSGLIMGFSTVSVFIFPGLFGVFLWWSTAYQLLRR